MTFTSMIRKTLSLAALTAVAGSAALSAGASAATIGPAEVVGPGQHIPIDFAGYKEPADKTLPKNYRIVRKQIELSRGEKASTVMTAPAGFRIITIGMANVRQVGGGVDDVNYPGKRSVRVRLFASRSANAQGETRKGTLYILARRA